MTFANKERGEGGGPKNRGLFIQKHCVQPFWCTRSYAALRVADLEWIIRPGYSLGRYFLEKNHEKPTWNHEKPWKTTKNQPGTMKNHEKPWKTKKNKPGTMKNHEKPWKTISNILFFIES